MKISSFCASEVFHAKVRQIIKGFEGVESLIDDILVWDLHYLCIIKIKIATGQGTTSRQ